MATWNDVRDERLRPGSRAGLVFPCYNEQDNLDELYERIVKISEGLPDYVFEMLLIPNASTAGTVAKNKAVVDRDPRVTLIVNARNFGHIRSPFHRLMDSEGDCAILLCTNPQDPPELIPRFLEAWRNGGGITKNNCFTLFDMAILGITSHLRASLRLATIAGFSLSALTMLMAVVFLGLKLCFWPYIHAGYAPAVISIFFLASVQMFLIGLVGEYVSAVLTQVRHRPIVVES